MEERFRDKNKIYGLNKTEVKNLLNLATKSSFFIFDKKIYFQKDGVSMGSPLGPTLANAFLCHYEKSWLNEAPATCRPIYYKRYVDDIFLLFQSKEQVKPFQDYMNTKHPNINFTFEIEEENSLSFLDVKTFRKISSNTFITSLYRKPTFSGVYTNFKSFISINYKKSLISSILFRVFHICYNYESIIDEIEKLKKIWIRNGYPLNLIEKIIKQFFNKLFVPKKILHTVPKKQLFISLEYLGQHSIQIKRSLEKIISKHIPYCKVNIVFSSNCKLRSFFLFKDKIPKNLRSGVLYKFCCSSCKTTYIGKSIRHFQIRYSEHLGISVLTNKPYTFNHKNSTSVNSHCHDCKHKNNSGSFKIIGTAKNDFHLKIKESLNILKEKPLLNKTVKSFPLYLFE